jgi:molybdenum cofactor biosynthesis enzyme MoaA
VKSETRFDRVRQALPSHRPEELFYVTALSNFARAYDKYARTYDKSKIPESTFPSRFFLLDREELQIGIAKARHLPRKTGLPGDRLIAIQSHAREVELHPNPRTGLGRYVDRGHVVVDAVHWIDPPARLRQALIEEVVAESLRAWTRGRPRFESLAPRSVSILPVARACPARCPFCFSKASVSQDTTTIPIDWPRIVEVLHAAAERGASRAVLTGGGEPSLLRSSDLLRLIRESAARFPKVVLISNGWKWGHTHGEARARSLRALERAGLSVLALSRHHHNSDRNAALMGVDTRSERIAATWSRSTRDWPRLKLRWICVLQRGGIEDRSGLEEYLDWSVSCGVEEVCFKELYVSTSVESEYHDREANEWSARHQVPLRLVLDLAEDAGWREIERLPWGAPVFEGSWRGRSVRVAAYSEPSLLWELAHGQCRSWNLMADGRCLASLEDKGSQVLARGLRSLQTVP